MLMKGRSGRRGIKGSEFCTWARYISVALHIGRGGRSRRKDRRGIYNCRSRLRVRSDSSDINDIEFLSIL